jgi:hypothetical protein
MKIKMPPYKRWAEHTRVLLLLLLSRWVTHASIGPEH